MTRRTFAIGCLAVSAAALVACTGNTTDQADATTAAATTERPTTSAAATASVAVSVPSAPAQTGDEQVQFDPCVRVSDDLVTRAGFDPASRERSAEETVSTILTTIGCQFWREELVDGEKYPTGVMSVTSSNLTLDDIRNNPGHSVFNSDSIGSREAVLYRTPQSAGTCSASIKSSDGSFTISLITHPGPIAVPPACDEIRRIAEIFSESLGAD